MLRWVCFLLLEETSFDRAAFSQHTVETILENNVEVSSEKKEPGAFENTTQQIPTSTTIYDAEVIKPYWKRLAIVKKSRAIKGYCFKQYVQHLFLQFRVLLFPATWYTGLHWGWGISWLSFYMTTEEEVWILSPWNYGSVALGIMMVPVFIGAVVGCFYSIYATDWLVAYAAKRNHGIQEAESRLWCMAPSFILGPLGLLLFGAGTEYQWSWPAPYIGLAFVGASFGITTDIPMAYLVDCYPEMSLESVIGVSMIYTLISFILCFVIEPWFKIGQMNTYIFPAQQFNSCSAVLRSH